MEARRLLRSVLLAALLVPFAAALAAPACVPRCEVMGVANKFVSPTLVVESGTNVTFVALDTGHVALESVPDARYACFRVFFAPGGGPGDITLRVVDGNVTAVQAGFATPKRCASAEPLADGSARVPYVCPLHPGMTGEIVVRPRPSN